MKKDAHNITMKILLTLQLLTLTRAFTTRPPSSPSTLLRAKPQRLPDNVEGVLYVNDRCINCAACSHFDPETFERRPGHHVVKAQPNPDNLEDARAALAACPVAAIRIEALAERRHRDKSAAESWTEHDEYLAQNLSINRESPPFPRPLLDLTNVHFLGHHNDKSFGATPYLLQAMHKGQPVSIMIDTPRYSPSAVRAIESLAPPNYLFLTHVDDTADHNQWVEHYPKLRRIFHSGDLGKHNWIGDQSLEEVEILLSGNSRLFTLDGEPLASLNDLPDGDDVAILHTPGHSPGSITLYKLPKDNSQGILFTGDTYAYSTRNGGHMSGFPMYGDDLRLQSETIQDLLKYDWEIIAPGHGHTRDYRGKPVDARSGEMEAAIHELRLAR